MTPTNNVHRRARQPKRRFSSSSATATTRIQNEEFPTHPRSRIVSDLPNSYASLPPTPISRSYSPPHLSQKELPKVDPEPKPFTLWDYLKEELFATDFDSHQELKWDRVSNFLSVPLAVEKIINFGFVLCLDSFLYTFTILPIRFGLAVWRLLVTMFTSKPLPPSQKADILRMLLLISSVAILVPLTNASKIYHSIRGQDTIKLYVIFNALEIADRLCASIGQDIIDCLFSRSTLEPFSRWRPTFRPVFFFVLALVYNVAHTLVLLYSLLSLNVAVNSYDHALLTLLMSNQFVEIKGSVFKKFEKDNLFQITCADIVERFTLTMMLFVVAFRNLIELSGSAFDLSEGFVLPRSFGWFRGGNILWTISYPVLTVLASEMMVDWLKHAFITKFNHIRPSVYERYTDVLCHDLASASPLGRLRKHTYVDQSPLVARRLGFASLPLAVLAIIIGWQSVSLLFSLYSDIPLSWFIIYPQTTDITQYMMWVTLGLVFWSCLVLFKILLGLKLVSYATTRQPRMAEREAEDQINDFGRDPIGESKEERNYNKELKKSLNNVEDDALRLTDVGEGISKSDGKRKKLRLEELTRFTMVKRIW